MNPAMLTELLARLKTGLAGLLGDQLADVYLYGSGARMEARPDSDVDVLVVVREPFSYFELVQRTGALAAELSLRYDTVVALAFVSTDAYQQQNSPFLLNVRQDAIAI
jgi:uncharacterized protein